MSERKWIDKVELENANIKWAWSHFDGRDPMSGDGNYNFVVVLDETQAKQLLEDGWNVKQNDPYEDGDDPEYTLTIKISYKIDPPRIFFLKNGRKFRVGEEDLADIRRDSTEQIDVIFKPSFWEKPPRSGITAYVEEMYVQVRQSRFGQKYEDYEDA